jgi:glycosyltransferase involved in cell wall biosynthesis
MKSSSLAILSARDGNSIKSRAKFFYKSNFKISKTEKEEFTNKFKFGGHQALRENLITGFHMAGIEFELSNKIPLDRRNIGLLAGKELLREFNRTRKHSAENIVVGPNLFVTPKGFEAELQNKLIKKIVVPAQWVADLWTREVPEISQKIVIWTVGIDFNFWQPLPSKQEMTRTKVIIYIKNEDNFLINQVKFLLMKKGFTPSIITYGQYSKEFYREELRNSIALVYIGKSESQGIALLEAWAMNVPTYVYNSAGAIVIRSESGEICLEENNYSTAPYLTDERGLFWGTEKELESHLNANQRFAPRSNSKIFSAENCAIEYAKFF